RDISQRYDVHFTYDREIVEDVEVEGYNPGTYVNVDDALSKVLAGTNLKYVMLEMKYVIIYQDDAEGMQSLEQMVEVLENIIHRQRSKRKLASLNMLQSSTELNRIRLNKHRMVLNVSGIVKDQYDQPLIGVNILVEGTNQGTATDLEGQFLLEDVDENATLVFSYIGYQTLEFPLNGRSNISIIMMEDVQTLDEVVVVGYGTQKKSDLTGSVQRVNIGLFDGAPNTNVLQSLSGIAPGLNVGKTYTTGSEPQLQIRGQNTLSGGTSPLIVLDGMVYRGSIGDINPSDVESVDILKDASSKAVYGAQAANGVIIITTKSGVRQKPTLNVSTYYSHQTPANSLRSLTREEFLQEARNHSYKKAYLAPDYLVPNPDFVITDNVQWNINTLDGYNKGVDYDWMGSATSPGYIFNTDVRVNGGSDDFSYMLSFNYNKQKGWV